MLATSVDANQPAQSDLNLCWLSLSFSKFGKAEIQRLLNVNNEGPAHPFCNQGPVVQSIVSFTSLLVVKC